MNDYINGHNIASDKNLIAIIVTELMDFCEISSIQNMQNLKDFANHFGGIIVQQPIKEDIVYKYSDSTFCISIPSHEPETETLWQAAVRLGDAILHMHALDISTGIDHGWHNVEQDKHYENRDWITQNQSNLFAAFLLMPPDKFRKLCNEHTEGDVVHITEIAKHLPVSVDRVHWYAKTMHIIQPDF